MTWFESSYRVARADTSSSPDHRGYRLVCGSESVSVIDGDDRLVCYQACEYYDAVAGSAHYLAASADYVHAAMPGEPILVRWIEGGSDHWSRIQRPYEV